MHQSMTLNHFKKERKEKLITTQQMLQVQHIVIIILIIFKINIVTNRLVSTTATADPIESSDSSTNEGE